MKYYLLLISLVFTSCFNAAQNRSTEDLLTLLNSAYEQKSVKKYEVFLNLWNKEITPLKDEELNKLPVKERNIYKLFKDIYNPIEYYERGKIYKYNNYSPDNFLVIQNKVYYYEISGDIDSSLWRSRVTKKLTLKAEDSLSNFRPRINYNKNKTLYLNNKYENILNKFLFGTLSDTSIFRRDKYLSDSAKIVIRDKVNFLNTKLHFENTFLSQFSYMYLSFPVMQLLTISNDYKKVIVEQMNTYASWTDIEYHLINDNWIDYEYLGHTEE